nr:MAG TPA: hypothetical protein [Caudoviricetes sp.]
MKHMWYSMGVGRKYLPRTREEKEHEKSGYDKGF